MKEDTTPCKSNQGSGSINKDQVHNCHPKSKEFVETEDFWNTISSFIRYDVLQLHGERLSGKTFSLNALLSYYLSTSQLISLPCVVWVFRCRQANFDIKNELKSLIEEVQKHKMITSCDARELLTKTTKTDNFIDLVRIFKAMRVNIVLAFDDVSPNFSKSVHSLILEVLNSKCPESSNQIKILVTTNKKNVLFDEHLAGQIDDFLQRKMKVFTEEEAVKYLSMPFQDDISNSFFANEKPLILREGFTDDDAKLLTRYYDCNPCCLRVAKSYCQTRKITYKLYLKSIKEKPSCKFIFKAELEILMKHDEGSIEAFKDLQARRPACREVKCVADVEKEFDERRKRILNVLTYLAHEEIPIHLIGLICQCLRSNSTSLTDSQNFLLNMNEALDFIYRMNMENHIENLSILVYPNGHITIPQRFSNVHEEVSAECLIIALKAMTKMAKKDNTKTSANQRLLRLKPHISCLTQHANRYLKVKFNIADEKKNSFMIAMLICRLFEMLAHATNRDQIEKSHDIALNCLMEAASLVWEMVCAYAKSKFSQLTCGIKGIHLADALEYSKDKDPEVQGHKIAKECSKSGMKVDSSALWEYWESFISFNKQNYSDFLQNTSETLRVSREEAKEYLKGIEQLVEQQLPCQSSHIDVLRKTGNLLMEKQLQQTFFAERLSSIFHTYGRQVRYLQHKISSEEQKKCEYYSSLAHHIAKATRANTGVGLLNEYITMANAIVPRLLQNRLDEKNEERKERLNEGLKRSKKLLQVDCKFFENACFRLVKDNAYTKLNAYRYIVKANIKMLKDENAVSTDEAYADCKTLAEIARNNCELSIAPFCIIYCARFLAATGRFDEAFETFKDGFNLKNPYPCAYAGLSHQRDWSPNSFAWAVYNFCRAVDAYAKKEKVMQSYNEREGQAAMFCKDVLSLEEISKEWRERIQEYSEKFQKKEP